MQIGPQIYKRTSSGAIQVYHIERDGAQYRSVTGKRGGKMVVSAWTTCEAKNVGKANEVSPEDQAISEVDAKYKKKLRQDFHSSTDEIDTVTRVKPMLAKKWADYADRFAPDEQIAYEPKLDGFRCIVNKDGLFTRDGLPIPTAPHIFEELQVFFKIDPTLELDGELYNHEFHDDFNAISSLLKKKVPTAAHLAKTRELVQYWIYDEPSNPGTLADRRSMLEAMFAQDDPIVEFNAVKLTPQFVGTPDEAGDYFIKFKEQNYEGAMGKPLNAKYEGKRTSNLLKIKEFQDEEFQIVDIESGRGSRANIAARAIMQLSDGRTFEAGMIGSHEYCKELLENKRDVIGQMATIQFLNYTPAGIPRGGKLKTVRWA
jgi:DNA ligase-1